MSQLLDEHQKQLRLQKRPMLKFLRALKKKPPKDLDSTVRELDEAVFEELDCLECANCCKTISPVFKQKDIDRIAARLRMKPGNFVKTYLKVDEDQDYVLQSSPCPFLESDNRCRIYEDRPAACREYPHTGKRNFHKFIGITQQNILYCPAAFRIVEDMMNHYMESGQKRK